MEFIFKIFKFLMKTAFYILKHIFLICSYCTSPEKYSKTFDEWLNENNDKE